MTPAMRDQLERLKRGEDVKSSDRESDRARTKLKKLGFVKFDRSVWQWFITPEGEAALSTTE